MDTTSRPLVSVIVTVYNAGDYFRPAIESLLSQSYSNIEIIIVDDGSTDGCVDTISDLKDSRIRLFRQPNRGRPSALNRALNELNGEFYAIQDADDLSMPTKIERQVNEMRRGPDLACVFTGYELILDGEHLAPQAIAKDPAQSRAAIACFQMPSHDPTAMYRVKLVKGMEYATDLPIAHAVDYTLRVGELHPMRVLGECLYSYRIHSASITKRDPAQREREVEEVLRRACSRRGIEYRSAAQRGIRESEHCRRDNNLAGMFIESVKSQRARGKYWGAIGTGLRCSRLHPFDAHYHKATAYALLPHWAVRRLKKVRKA